MWGTKISRIESGGRRKVKGMHRLQVGLSCRLRWMFAVGLFVMASLVGRAETPSGPLRVAIVGLEHGHVEGFLSQLPKHPDVELVGIADADPTLWSKYGKKYSLADTLFYKSMANMIERCHPQAVLVYTSIGEHRHAIEIAAQYGVSVMVEKPLTISAEDAIAIRKIANEHYI